MTDRRAPDGPGSIRVSPLRTAILRLTGMLVVLLAALPARAGHVVLDVLDVGQGDGLVIRAGGKVVLVDAGEVGADVVGQLRQLGVHRVDLAVGTHPHADHIGGMRDVVEQLDVRRYLDNGLRHTTQTFLDLERALEARGVERIAPIPGTVLRLGEEATLTVLAPPTTAFVDTRSDLNSNSVVLHLAHGTVDMLLTGDAEAPTEAWLVDQGLGPVEVLKVPHHGSDHSSTARFVAATEPEIAVVSCGADNRYGHPGAAAMARLSRHATLVYRTDRSGMVRIVSDGTHVDAFEGSLDRLGRRWPLDALEASP